MKMRLVFAGLFIAAMLVSFAVKRSRTNANGVTQFSQNDAGMNAAISQARGSVEQFVARLGRPVSAADFVSVKIGLPTSDGSREHMWCDNVKVSGGTFTANIANEPVDTKYKIGQQVSAAKGEISDWMYVEKGQLVGGYTLRHMVSQMSASEREQFKRSVPFKID